MSLKTNESNGQTAVLSDVLVHLQDVAQSPSFSLLTGLSDLGADELKLFKDAWNTLSAERKCAILSHLRELAEDNVIYDFSAVFKHALYNTEDDVRQSAIEGLWENEESSLIFPLLKIISGSGSDALRQSAATALGRFATLAECHRIDSDNVVLLSQALLTIANDPSEPILLRRRALEAAAPLSLADVTHAIWTAYRHQEVEMQVGAIQAMGLNRDLLWLPTIIQELASDNPEVRYAAATAAGELEEAEAVPSLIELVDDLDPEVRLAAVQALGNIGGNEAKQVLKNLTKHDDQPLRDAAAHALATIELLGGITLPKQFMTDDSPS